MTCAKLIDVQDLHVRLSDAGVTAHIVKGITLSVARGEILGVIGESGSGKTITGLALLGLLPGGAQVCAEKLRFHQHDLLGLSKRKFDALRGVGLAMIFQDPVTSFNPAKSIAWHFGAIYRRMAAGRGQACPADWRGLAASTLQDVGIVRVKETLQAYPHQISGGMLQRVLIAMVLTLRPDFVIADEPTTNLDKLVEKQVLALFQDMQRNLAAGMLFITHDMQVAASLCTHIAVMYAGGIVEMGTVAQVFDSPLHPYTRLLVATSVALSTGHTVRLPEIAGAPPSPTVPLRGCAFADRCPDVLPKCRTQSPPQQQVDTSHIVHCFLRAGESDHG